MEGGGGHLHLDSERLGIWLTGSVTAPSLTSLTCDPPSSTFSQIKASCRGRDQLA
jgi:hypothetical protein